MSVVKETVDAGVEQARRRIQMLQLGREVEQKEREIAAAVARLGQVAWDQRVEDPAYAEEYARLLDLAAQQESLRRRIADLEQQIQAETAARDATETEWKARLESLAAERAPVAEELTRRETTSQTTAERLRAAERELARTQRERQTVQDRLAELDRLTAPDVEQRRARLLSRLAGLEQAIAGLEAQLPDLRRTVEENTAAQPSLQARLAELDDQITQTRAQKGAAVGAHEVRLADLRVAVKELRSQIAALDSRAAQISAAMGPAVDQARPDAAALREAYAAIDALEAARIDLLAQLADLKAEYEAADITAVRRFYVVVGGLVIFAGLVLACCVTTFLAGWILFGAGR